MNKQKILRISIIMVMLLALAVMSAGVSASPLAAYAPGLGDAYGFSALAALSASSANTTTISGNLGLSPGLDSSITGPWVIGGTQYAGPLTLAANAQSSALGAFNDLAGQGSNGTWASTNPPAGAWTIASDQTFSGTLTLDGGYNDVWVFQIGRDLTFSGSVVMSGNAQACNVYWQVGRSATIASGSGFIGTLIASESISVVSGASVEGRVLALNGSLTTDNNTISSPRCDSAPAGSTAVPAGHTSSVSGLPNTGGGPMQNGFPWGIVIAGGVLTLGLGLLIYRRIGFSK
jgi:hypothetical protein